MVKKKNKYKSSTIFPKGKEPKYIKLDDTALFKWSFKRMDKSHSCWQELSTLDFITEVIHKLEDYSTQTWAMVKSASGGKAKGNGTNNHFVEYPKLTKKYQKLFANLPNVEDLYESIFSLRLMGVQRLFGVVINQVFFIIWYDSNHKISPYHK